VVQVGCRAAASETLLYCAHTAAERKAASRSSNGAGAAAPLHYLAACSVAMRCWRVLLADASRLRAKGQQEGERILLV